MSPRLTRCARLALLVAAAALAATWLTAAEPDDSGPGALLNRLQTAWQAKDVDGYLSLWEFEASPARSEEGEFARAAFATGQSRLSVQRPAPAGAALELVNASAQAVYLDEPHGYVEQLIFGLRRTSRGWAIIERQSVGRIDGLVHLSLDPQGFSAEGLSVKLEDFELEMGRGTLFAAPAALGPTVLVFVGDASVRVRPRPETEREQLRQFCGRPELVERVHTAFLRLHPADVAKVLLPTRFEPDPAAAKRFSEAERFYREHATRSYVLDGDLPGSPWWVLPSHGDSLVSFETERRGTLTFTVNGSQPESISLFSRERRLQICLYPSGGKDTSYNEDDTREIDVLHHEMSLRFEPRENHIQGEDTLHFRLLQPLATIRLKLAESMQVQWITSPQGGRHLFFRVRNQDILMVSLGPLSGASREIALTVRYAGSMNPEPVEQEVLQTATEPETFEHQDVPIEKVLVFSNRYAWYPQPPSEDHATASFRFDVPQGFTVVTGGQLLSTRAEGERTIIRYSMERPGKYYTVAGGRLFPAGTRQEGLVSLRAFAVPRARGIAEETLGKAADMIRFFTQEFGPCPYAFLNLVLIEGVTPGGHSPPGMVVLQRRPLLLRGTLREDPANFSDVDGFFLAHELAHQWWGQGVAPENYRERWLSEGMAQYAAALWARHAHGEEQFQDILKRMARWAMKDNARGPINLGNRLGHIKGGPEIYRAVVYDKGAYVLHMLRGIAGEDAFRRAIMAFQESHRYAKAGTNDLQAALEAATGDDLSAYFREWIFGTTLPSLQFTHHAHVVGDEHRTAIDVSVSNLPGPVPLELTVTHDGGRKSMRVTLLPAGGTFSIDTPAPPRKVEINGDRGLLAASKS